MGALDFTGTPPGVPQKLAQEVTHMPTSKELAIRMEDRPGTLGKVCGALAERGVNVLAFQSFPSEGASLVRLVVDNPATAKSVLDAERLSYTETEVAQIRLPNRPGELARAAAELGAANINIDYAYCGADSTNAPLLIFGVAEVAKATTILDQTGAKAA
jgi:hypothetical protein